MILYDVFGTFGQEILAQRHTLVADRYLIADDELLYRVLVLAAETAGFYRGINHYISRFNR
jgi:hypothetical protein